MKLFNWTQKNWFDALAIRSCYVYLLVMIKHFICLNGFQHSFLFFNFYLSSMNGFFSGSTKRIFHYISSFCCFGHFCNHVQKNIDVRNDGATIMILKKCQFLLSQFGLVFFFFLSLFLFNFVVFAPDVEWCVFFLFCVNFIWNFQVVRKYWIIHSNFRYVLIIKKTF